MEKDEESESFGDRMFERRKLVYWKSFLLFTILNVVLLILHLLLISSQDRISNSPIFEIPSRRGGINAALKQISSYSPLLDLLDIEKTVVHFDGTFFNNSSIYRQDPSPAVDEAWKFFDHDILAMSADTVKRSHKDPSRAIKIDAKWGLGDDAYLGTFDVFHQIHCLNTLRKEIHYQHYWGNSAPSTLHISHRNHCLHMLLQSILCHSDVDVITYEWVYMENDRDGEKIYTPWPDFNIEKTCRKFEDLYAWAKENTPDIAQQLYEEIQKPEGVPARSLYDT